MKHKARLFSLGTLELTKTLLELPVCGLDDGKSVMDVWPRVVPALVPAVGALFQGFVVAFLVLLNETFQADVSANLEPQMVALQE